MPPSTDSDDSEELEILLVLALLLFVDHSDDESSYEETYTKKKESVGDRLEVKRSKMAR
jgi:hypothetical protein